MLYPIPYIAICAILGVLSILIHQHPDDKDYCRKLTMAGMVACVVFLGFRGFVFHDWYIYYPEFEKLSFYDIQKYEIGSKREIGWLCFQWICKSIFDNYHFMIFVHSVITLSLLYRFLNRYTQNILLGIIIYLIFDGFTLSINLLRNSFAIMIFLNALPYLYERRPLQYVGLCLLAMSFHFSAFFYLPLYFFLHRNTNRWVFASIYLVGFFIYIANIPIFLTAIRLLGYENDFLTDKIEAYSNLSISLKISIGLLERLMTGILIFCYYDKLKSLNKENVMFINTFIIYILSVFLISEFSEISKRISIIFVFCYWVIWIYLIKCFYYSNNRKLFITFVVLYGILKIAAPIRNQPVCEYDNILLGGIKSYQERKYTFDRTFDSDN